MSLNSVNIMGNLTRDPELKYTNSGRAVCNLSIANNRIYTKDGERVTEVSYFDIEAWGPVGENCAKYLSKGSGIIVEGRLKQDRWESEGKTQSRIRITASNIHFMPRRQNESNQTQAQNQQPAGSTAGTSQDAEINEQDIAWDE